jgi:hypothetical protein
MVSAVANTATIANQKDHDVPRQKKEPPPPPTAVVPAGAATKSTGELEIQDHTSETTRGENQPTMDLFWKEKKSVHNMPDPQIHSITTTPACCSAPLPQEELVEQLLKRHWNRIWESKRQMSLLLDRSVSSSLDDDGSTSSSSLLLSSSSSRPKASPEIAMMAPAATKKSTGADNSITNDDGDDESNHHHPCSKKPRLHHDLDHSLPPPGTRVQHDVLLTTITQSSSAAPALERIAWKTQPCDPIISKECLRQPPNHNNTVTTTNISAEEDIDWDVWDTLYL